MWRRCSSCWRRPRPAALLPSGTGPRQVLDLHPALPGDVDDLGARANAKPSALPASRPMCSGAYVAAFDTILVYRARWRLRRFAAGGVDPNDLAMTWRSACRWRGTWACLPQAAAPVDLPGIPAGRPRRGGAHRLARRHGWRAIVALLIVPLTMTAVARPAGGRDRHADRRRRGSPWRTSPRQSSSGWPPPGPSSRTSASAAVQALEWRACEAFAQQPLWRLRHSGSFKAVSPQLGSAPPQVAHNSFISVLVEQGIVGLRALHGDVRAVSSAPASCRCWSDDSALVLLATLGVAMLPLTWEDHKRRLVHPGSRCSGFARRSGPRPTAQSVRPGGRSGRAGGTVARLVPAGRPPSPLALEDVTRMTPRVSVVTTVYNGEPYFDRAVPGILAQTFEDFEFILVDDGSTDARPRCCGSWPRGTPRSGCSPPAGSGAAAATTSAWRRHGASTSPGRTSTTGAIPTGCGFRWRSRCPSRGRHGRRVLPAGGRAPGRALRPHAADRAPAPSWPPWRDTSRSRTPSRRFAGRRGAEAGGYPLVEQSDRSALLRPAWPSRGGGSPTSLRWWASTSCTTPASSTARSSTSSGSGIWRGCRPRWSASWGCPAGCTCFSLGRHAYAYFRHGLKRVLRRGLVGSKERDV